MSKLPVQNYHYQSWLIWRFKMPAGNFLSRRHLNNAVYQRVRQSEYCDRTVLVWQTLNPVVLLFSWTVTNAIDSALFANRTCNPQFLHFWKSHSSKSNV